MAIAQDGQQLLFQDLDAQMIFAGGAGPQDADLGAFVVFVQSSSAKPPGVHAGVKESNQINTNPKVTNQS